MGRLAPARVGVAFGVFLGAGHALWSVLVAAGLAQTFMDFVFWLHFIRPPFTLEPFELMRALLLVAVTGAIGFVLGSVLAVIWNSVHRSSAS